MRSEADAWRVLGPFGARWGRGRSGSGIEVERDLVVEAVHQMPVARIGYGRVEGEAIAMEGGVSTMSARGHDKHAASQTPHPASKNPAPDYPHILTYALAAARLVIGTGEPHLEPDPERW